MVYYGFTQLDSMIQMWQAYGVFSVFIPFVLIFAVVFAILSKSKILGGKSGIDTIVAIAIALLSLQWDFMPRFFSELFPRLGMGIAVLLALVILVGMFITSKHETVWMIILASIAFIIFIVVLIQTQIGFNWSASPFWQNYGFMVIMGVVIVGLIVGMVLSNPSGKKE